jgi:hypothetical protein
MLQIEIVQLYSKHKKANQLQELLIKLFIIGINKYNVLEISIKNLTLNIFYLNFLLSFIINTLNDHRVT